MRTIVTIILLCIPNIGYSEANDPRLLSALRISYAARVCAPIEDRWSLAKSSLALGSYEVFITLLLDDARKMGKLLGSDMDFFVTGILHYLSRTLVLEPESDYNFALCYAFIYADQIIGKSMYWDVSKENFRSMLEANPSFFNRSDAELRDIEANEKLFCQIVEIRWNSACVEAHWWGEHLSK